MTDTRPTAEQFEAARKMVRQVVDSNKLDPVATLLSDRDRLRDELERAKAWERVLVELFTRADSLALTAYIEQQSEDEETSEMYDRLAREVALEALNIIREYVRKSRTSPDAGQGERGEKP